MPQYRLTPPVHKSNWRNIWEGIKDAWRAVGVFGKLTFVFPLVWSLLILGFMRKMITVIFVALAVAAVAVVVTGLVVWGMLEVGYKFFLHPVTMFLAIPWMVVGFSYLYLKKKYPGKYAEVFGYNTDAKYVRSTPIVGGIMLSVMFIAYHLIKPFLWWIMVGVIAIIAMVVIYYVVKSLTNGSGDETTKKAKEILIWILCIAVGLAMINWLLWTLDEELWGSVWATQSRFWAINLGILFAILLLLLIKGADGKPHPTAKTFSQVIGVLVALILVLCVWDFFFGAEKVTTWSVGWSIPKSEPFFKKLAVIEATEEWSVPVYNPGADSTKLRWGRLDTTKGGVCEVMLDDNPKRVFPINTFNDQIVPKKVRFRCTEEGAVIRVAAVPDHLTQSNH